MLFGRVYVHTIESVDGIVTEQTAIDICIRLSKLTLLPHSLEYTCRKVAVKT